MCVGSCPPAINTRWTSASPAARAAALTETGMPAKRKISSALMLLASAGRQRQPACALVLVMCVARPSMHVGAVQPQLVSTAQRSAHGLAPMLAHDARIARAEHVPSP